MIETNRHARMAGTAPWPGAHIFPWRAAGGRRAGGVAVGGIRRGPHIGWRAVGCVDLGGPRGPRAHVRAVCGVCRGGRRRKSPGDVLRPGPRLCGRRPDVLRPAFDLPARSPGPGGRDCCGRHREARGDARLLHDQCARIRATVQPPRHHRGARPPPRPPAMLSPPPSRPWARSKASSGPDVGCGGRSLASWTAGGSRRGSCERGRRVWRAARGGGGENARC